MVPLLCIHEVLLIRWKYSYKVLIMLFLALTACTHSMTGKILPPANYPQFAGGTNGHHIIKFREGIAKLDYDWFINNQENTLTLIGTYDFNFPGGEFYTRASYKWGNVTISAFLLDKNYKVLKVEQLYFPIDPDTELKEQKNPFKMTFPYNQDYKFITFEIRWEGSAG